jgi:hypothetical protein
MMPPVPDLVPAKSGSQDAFDKFTLVHLVVGIIAGLLLRPYSAFPLVLFVAIAAHQIFELWENHEGANGGHAFFSIPCIQNIADKFGLGWSDYGGDSAQNSAMDTLAFATGLFLAVGIKTP